MIPNVDENILIAEFDLSVSNGPKPEAPWIKRCDYGIKFTDEIQIIDESTNDGLITETEESTMLHNERGGENAGYDDDSSDQSPDSQSRQGQIELNERYYLRNYVKE